MAVVQVCVHMFGSTDETSLSTQHSVSTGEGSLALLERVYRLQSDQQGSLQSTH